MGSDRWNRVPADRRPSSKRTYSVLSRCQRDLALHGSGSGNGARVFLTTAVRLQSGQRLMRSYHHAVYRNQNRARCRRTLHAIDETLREFVHGVLRGAAGGAV
jgi:hypothetical protein